MHNITCYTTQYKNTSNTTQHIIVFLAPCLPCVCTARRAPRALSAVRTRGRSRRFTYKRN